MKKLFKKNTKTNRIVKAFKDCSCTCCSCAGFAKGTNKKSVKEL